MRANLFVFTRLTGKTRCGDKQLVYMIALAHSIHFWVFRIFILFFTISLLSRRHISHTEERTHKRKDVVSCVNENQMQFKSSLASIWITYMYMYICYESLAYILIQIHTMPGCSCSCNCACACAGTGYLNVRRDNMCGKFHQLFKTTPE